MVNIEQFATVLFLLACGHAVADYALQSDFIAQAKNHKTELGKMFWKHVLPAHALIHGLAVYLATGMAWLGIAETIIHAATDYAKSDGRISLNTDQLIHYGCKIMWAVIFVMSI